MVVVISHPADVTQQALVLALPLQANIVGELIGVFRLLAEGIFELLLVDIDASEMHVYNISITGSEFGSGSR